MIGGSKVGVETVFQGHQCDQMETMVLAVHPTLTTHYFTSVIHKTSGFLSQEALLLTRRMKQM
jgi:hypothetical protein